MYLLQLLYIKYLYFSTEYIHFGIDAFLSVINHTMHNQGDEERNMHVIASSEWDDSALHMHTVAWNRLKL